SCIGHYLSSQLSDTSFFKLAWDLSPSECVPGHQVVRKRRRRNLAQSVRLPCDLLTTQPQIEKPPYRITAGKGVFFCAPERIRTSNLLIRSQMLYPLSYGRVPLP